MYWFWIIWLILKDNAHARHIICSHYLFQFPKKKNWDFKGLYEINDQILKENLKWTNLFYFLEFQEPTPIKVFDY